MVMGLPYETVQPSLALSLFLGMEVVKVTCSSAVRFAYVTENS